MTIKALEDVIDDLEKTITDTVLCANDISTNNANDVPTLLRFFKKLKENNDKLEALFKISNETERKLSYEIIPTAFENAGMDSIKLAGRNFILGVRLDASIKLDDREKGYKWLKENGLGALIQPNVNSKTLSSAIKNFIEEKGILPPEESGIKLNKQRYIQMRKV